MDYTQLKELIVEPTLREIPSGYSKAAVNAVMMIIAHESMRGTYLKQVGGGPALGLGQMEPATYYSTWENADSIWDNALALGVITGEQFHLKIVPDAERMVYDLRFMVFMIRQRLFMDSEPLPLNGKPLSKYLKRFWNAGGKADELSYYRDHLSWEK